MMETSTTSTPKTEDQYPNNFILNATSGASIHAALCFILQLMMILRKLLDIHMPYKQHYKLLYDVNPGDLKTTIKRLNYNVCALCTLCNVDLSTMHPLHTLRNINSAVEAYKLLIENGPSYPPYDLIDSIQRTLNDGSEPPSDSEEITFENSPDFDAIDWDKIRNEDIAKGQDISEIEKQPHSEPFQSVADDMNQLPQGLVSSAVSWVTKGWWNK